VARPDWLNGGGPPAAMAANGAVAPAAVRMPRKHLRFIFLSTDMDRLRIICRANEIEITVQT
jgi:hypothetical protein